VLPYLPSVVLGILGMLLFAVVMRSVRRSVQRFSGAAALAGERLAGESGLLRARTAALGVAVRQRPRDEGPARRVPSGEPAQTTGGRP
jgi:hypothetical protein